MYSIMWEICNFSNYDSKSRIIVFLKNPTFSWQKYHKQSQKTKHKWRKLFATAITR